MGEKISEHLLPRTRAYAEIWLDQKKVATTDEEPILGQTYLPRKFKTTVVIPPQNDIDLRQRHELRGDRRKRQAGGL